MSTKTCLSRGNVCVSLEVMPTFQMSSGLLLTTSPQNTTKTPRRADLPFHYRMLRCRACKPLCDPHAKAKSPQVDPFRRSMTTTSQCQQGVCSRTCRSGCYTVSKRRAADVCGASKHPSSEGTGHFCGVLAGEIQFDVSRLADSGLAEREGGDRAGDRGRRKLAHPSHLCADCQKTRGKAV